MPYVKDYEYNEMNNKIRRLEEAEKKRIEDSKKALSAIVYCSNCQIVGSVTVPKGVSIHESGCAWCGCRNTGYLVRKVADNVRYSI